MAAIPVFTQQIINGTIESASQPVPADAQFITAGCTMSDADASNTKNTANLAIYVTYDGLTWVTDPAWQESPWQGGLNRFGNPNPPNIGISVPSIIDGNGNQVRAQRAKVILDTLGNSLNTGLTLDIR